MFQLLNKQVTKLLGEEDQKDGGGISGTDGNRRGGGDSSSNGTPVNGIPVKTEYPNPNSVSPAASSVATIDVKKIKLRDFKINNGTIGKAKGNIKWGSLCFQIKQGLSQGYSERDIMLGVINAMKEGSSEQTFFQLSMDDSGMTHEVFMGMLRSLYGVEDSNKLCDQMIASVQEPNESLMSFILRMNGFRKQIMQITVHEDCPLTEGGVRKRFTNATLAGLRDPTIRLELKPILLSSSISDHQLMIEVNEIEEREAENRRKLGLSAAGVNRVETTEKDFCTKEEGKILGQLSKLTAQLEVQQTQFHQQQKTIEQLQQQMNNNNNNNRDNRDNNNFRGGGRRRFTMKCAKCEEEGIYCTHCSKCGETGHKKAACTKND